MNTATRKLLVGALQSSTHFRGNVNLTSSSPTGKHFSTVFLLVLNITGIFGQI